VRGREIAMKIRIAFALAAVTAVALVPAASGVVRPQTTEPTAMLDIYVTITDSKITLSGATGERGQGVNFWVHNVGKRVHNFVLRGTGPLALTSLGLGTHLVKPKTTVDLQVFLDFRGQMGYKSTVRTDLSKPGMSGTFQIV
jgi:hypothetical protein